MLSGTGAAFGLDLANGQQRALGQGGAYQLIDQHREQHHVPGQNAVGKVRGGHRHAQCHASLGQQRDAQMVRDGLGLLGDQAAHLCAIILTGRTGNDIDNADDQGNGLCQHLQIQLGTGQDEEQDVQRHGPAVHTVHQLFTGGADIAEDGTGHHADQQQGEAAMYRTYLELQHAQTGGQHDEGNGQGHTLAAGVEELLRPVQQEAHQAAQAQGQDDLHDRLDDDSQDADLTVGQGGGDAVGHGEQQQTHRIVQGNHQHQQPGHGAVGLVLPHDHHGRGRRGSGGNGTQGNGAGNGDDLREEHVQGDQHDIHHHGGDDGLQDADGDGSHANGLQLAQAEFIAHRERDEAQSRLGDDAQDLHLLQAVEAKAGQLQRAQEVGSQQKSGHQITGNGGKMDQPGHSGQQQATHQRHGKTNQIRFHRNLPSSIQDRKRWNRFHFFSLHIIAPSKVNFKIHSRQSFPGKWKFFV